MRGWSQRAAAWLMALTINLSVSAPALIAQQEQAKESSTEKSQDIDEIIVEADPYLKKLKGKVAEAFSAFRSGDYKVAEIQFERLSGDVAGHYMVQSLILGQNGAPSSTAVIDRMHKDENVVFYMHGLSLARQGRYEEAREPLKKAWRINPRDYQARLDYALVTILAGKPHKAKWQMRKVHRYAQKCGDECAEFVASVAHLEAVYAEAIEAQSEAEAVK